MKWHNYPNRLVCSVLDEMKNSVRHLCPQRIDHHKKYLNSCIEEIQTYVNRMEGGLEDLRDIREAHEEKRRLARELKALQAEIDELKGENPGHE